MALVIKDRVKETTTTTGTGTYTLAGAVTGFETFTTNLSNSDTTYYCCTDGTNFEVGLGTFTSSGTTLARTTILASSNSDSAVNWSSGTRTIFIVLPADKAVIRDGDENVTIYDDQNNADVSLVMGTSATESLTIQVLNGSSNKTAEEIHFSTATASATANHGKMVFDVDGTDIMTIDDGGIDIASGKTFAINGSDIATTDTTYSAGTLLDLSSTTFNVDLSEASAAVMAEADEFVFLDNDDSSAAKRESLSDLLDTVAGTVGTTGLDRSGATLVVSDLHPVGVDGSANQLLTDDGDGTVTSESTLTYDSGDLTITSTDAGAGDDPSLILYRNSSSPADYDDMGEIVFRGRNDNSQDVDYARIWAEPYDVSDGTEGGRLRFDSITSGTQTNIFASGWGYVWFDHHIHLNAGKVLQFEGATNDAYETIVTVADPTADRTITLPDATGTVLVQDSNDDIYVTSTDAGSGADPSLIFYRNSSSPADYDDIGQILFRGRNDNSQDVEYGRIYVEPYDVSDGTEDSRMHFNTMYGGTETTFMNTGWGYVYFYSNLYLTTAKTIMFEGATANSNETVLTVADPSQDNTITLPDATGTVLTTGNSDAGATTTSSSDVDHVLVDDGGVLKKITVANLGTATTDDATALAIALG